MTIRKWGIAAVLVAGTALAACGGSKDLTRKCNKQRLYQEAQAHEKLEVPDDLDELDELKEMPLPEAAPVSEREAAETSCLKLPPGMTDPVR